VFKINGICAAVILEDNMMRILIFWLGAILFLNPALSAQNTGGNDAKIAGIKKRIERIERKDKGRVTVKLINGTKINGTILTRGDSDFTIDQKDTNATVRIAYADVASTDSWVTSGGKIWIALGVAVLVFAAVAPR
jgi:sRNA-binding regulator protein Hfq